MRPSITRTLDRKLLTAAFLCIGLGVSGCASAERRNADAPRSAATIQAVSPDELPNFETKRPPFPASIHVEGDRLANGRSRIVPEFKTPELTAEEKKKLGADQEKRYDPLAFYRGPKPAGNVSRELAGPSVGIGRADTAGADAYGRGDRRIVAAGVMQPVALVGYGEPRAKSKRSPDVRIAGGQKGHEDGGVTTAAVTDPRRASHERKQED